MSNDLGVGITTNVPNGSRIIPKPSYLLTLKDLNKAKTKNFITIDKPEILQGFVLVKGFFTDLSDDDISNKITEVLTNIKKELIIEVMFASHIVLSMRSLVFKAK
jgi:hypothetical protein